MVVETLNLFISKHLFETIFTGIPFMMGEIDLLWKECCNITRVNKVVCRFGSVTTWSLVLPLDSSLIEPFIRTEIFRLSKEFTTQTLPQIEEQKHISTFNDESDEDDDEESELEQTSTKKHQLKSKC